MDVRQISVFEYLGDLVSLWQENIRHKGTNTQIIHKEDL